MSLLHIFVSDKWLKANGIHTYATLSIEPYGERMCTLRLNWYNPVSHENDSWGKEVSIGFATEKGYYDGQKVDVYIHPNESRRRAIML